MGREAFHGFSIKGTGTYLPARVVPSTEIDARAGLAPGTTEAAFGLSTRRYAGPQETSSAMAAAAAADALADAGWEPGDLDAVIGACGVMEQPIPGTSVLVQRRLGLGASGIPAFDVNATCLSFLPAFDHALAGMALGRWRRVLIACADIASAALDYSDPEASAIFGDGAVAVVLEASGPHEVLASRFESYGDHADLCRLEAGGTRLRPSEDMKAFMAGTLFRMQGVRLFKATARRFQPFLERLMAEAGVGLDDVSTVIPHQASAPALAHLARLVGGDRTRVINSFAELGNRIATGMPHALHLARRAGRLEPGSVSLLIGSSAGVSLGGCVVRW